MQLERFAAYFAQQLASGDGQIHCSVRAGSKIAAIANESLPSMGRMEGSESAMLIAQVMRRPYAEARSMVNQEAV